ncbi:unnamed protein product [Chondrus crispus]|uniref:Uncharacterized protein n=1 Tax=Chondrus crispus TaxID=2769 RepID=R7QKY0_CHOCR|nr:unnamed protein product [Chondrus crispus]CDF39177.1 unnamed protein product [Chondrus crispus]|eukprot:XP_005719088.1 unnamed protein product [Chondrus crispus]
MRGNTGEGPIRALDETSLATGGQRWRFIPLNQRLKNASARHSSLPSTLFDSSSSNVNPDDTIFSHLSAALVANSEINITTTFSEYVQQVKPLTHSLPLIYRNRKRIVTLTLDALLSSTKNAAEATPSIANCLTALAKDLGSQEFLPFFSRMVEMFAVILDTGRTGGKLTDDAVPKGSTATVLWDPEVSMVPLFATLAEITKECLHPLASNPAQTITDLIPLLSNAHFRVREMTAESCLGYIVRKSRDVVLVKDLVCKLLEVSEDNRLRDGKDLFLLDGLGDSLYEAVRLPSGRLHSRACEVLRHSVLRANDFHASASNGHEFVTENRNRMLQVISLCLSRLSRHLKSSADIRSVGLVFLEVGNAAKREGNAQQTGNVAFLSNRWLQSTDRSVTSSHDQVLLQKFLLAFSGWAGTFASNAYVVYECLGGIAIIICTSLGDKSRESTLRVFCSVLSKVSNTTEADTLLCAIDVIVRMQTWKLQLVDQSVLIVFSKVCDQLATITDPMQLNDSSCRVSVVALNRALAVLRPTSRGEVWMRLPSVKKLRIPTLERQLLTMVSQQASSKPAERGDKPMSGLLESALEYLSLVPFFNDSEALQGLISMKGLKSDGDGRLLSAVIVQIDGNLRDNSPSFQSDLLVLVDRILVAAEKSTVTPLGIESLVRFIQLFPTQAKKIFQRRLEKSEKYIEVLSSNLGSSERSVRMQTTEMLHDITCCLLDEGVSRGGSYSKNDFRGNVSGIIEDMQSSLLSEGSLPKGFFAALRHVLRTLSTLSEIDEILRLLREMARLLAKSSNVHRLVLTASVHFSVGLLRTPFKMLWECAGSIWSAAASHMGKEAVGVMMQNLKLAENNLILLSNAKRESHTDLDVEDVELAGSEGKGPCDPASESNRDQSREGTSEAFLKTHHLPREGVKHLKRSRSSSGAGRKKMAFWQQTLRQWDHEEWKMHCQEKVCQAIAEMQDATEEGDEPGILEGTTDSSTMLRQILRILSEDHHIVSAFRNDILLSYLHLDPSLFSRSEGDSLAISFASLLAKLGGLRLTNTDDRELLLRRRLLTDLTRPNPALQLECLRCLSSTRLNPLKPYRESFIRLTKDATFRDELSKLGDTLLPNLESGERGNIPTEVDDFILDVVLRICFSKMTGKANRTESRRAAALVFIVSNLPISIAIPRIIDLVLAPVAGIVSETQEGVRDGTAISIKRFPPVSVQMGQLTSIESIMKHCLKALDAASCRKLSAACLAMLQNASSGSTAKAIRSRSLRILAKMCDGRAHSSADIVLPVLAAMRKSNFEVTRRSHNSGLPSLLCFVAAVFKSSPSKEQQLVVMKEPWAVIWSLHVLKAKNSSPEAVQMSLVVARGICDLIIPQLTTSSEQPDSVIEISSDYSEVTCELVSALQQLLHRLTENVLTERNARKHWDPIFHEALLVVERMIHTSSLQSHGLVSIASGLVLYLENSHTFESTYEHALRVLTAISQQLSVRRTPTNVDEINKSLLQVRASAMKLLPFFSHARFVRQPGTYTQLCKFLAVLDAPDLQAAANYLQMMNAMEKSRVDSPDVDCRIDGLNLVISAFKSATETSTDQSISPGEVRFSLPGNSAAESHGVVCSADAITAITHGCICLVMFDDVAVRGTSGYALQLIGEWSGISNLNSARVCQSRIFRLLMEAVGTATTGTVRREYTKAFAAVVRHAKNVENHDEWNGYSSFPLLKLLSNRKDVDSDFFDNIVHLQAHRRSRALRLIRNSIFESNDCSSRDALTSLASHFALPVAMQIALELSEDVEQRNVSSRHAESRAGAESDVAVWAIELVGVAARWLPWPELKTCIRELMKDIRHCEHEKRSRTLYKLLVAVVEAIPHTISVQDGLDGPSRDFLTGNLLPALLGHITAGGIGGNHVEINELVQTKQNRYKRGSSGAVFRAPVASAIAHLLTCFPGSDGDVIIPQLVAPLANALRSRKTAVRDSAKKALNSIIMTLGTRYLPYIIQQVLSALKEGFRKDACVYVIHSILVGIRDKTNDTSKNGNSDSLSLDGAAQIIAKYLADELQSGASTSGKDFEDPNATAFFQKQASSRAIRSCECAEILAQQIDFGKSARIVLLPFRNLLSSTSSSKLISRTENLLGRVLTGLAKNCSMKSKDALTFCYELISAQKDSEWLHDATRSDHEPPEANVLKELYAVSRGCATMVSFGLQLMCIVVSKNQILFSGVSSESREYQAMLEPFLPLIVQALRTKHDTLTLFALRATQKLMKLPLSNKSIVAQMMSDRIVDVLSHSGGVMTHGDVLFNSCLRAAAVLMYDGSNGGFKALSKDRVEALISVSCKSLESGGLEARSAAIALLKAAVGSKIMISAVYDAIERVNEMAIHSQSSSLRSSCTSLSVQFAVSFPLGSKRVRQHLEFFVRNLNYELPTGRLAALQVIRTLILKFPSDALTDESQYLFVALAASAARDSDGDCRSCASEALQLLFEKASSGRGIYSLLQMSTALAGVKSDMIAIDDHIEVITTIEDDVQLSGAVALSRACKSRRMTSSQLNMIVRVVTVVLTDRLGEGKWETVYGLLDALESAFDVQETAVQSERLEVQQHTLKLWDSLPLLLIHKHPWVRLSSARLLGSHLSVHGDNKRAAEKRPAVPFSLLWESSTNVRNILNCCCAQLEASSISESLVHQCLKNILCIANVLFHNPAIGDLAREPRAGKRDIQQENQNAVIVPTSLKTRNPGLHWLVCRVSGLATRPGTEAADSLRRGCAMRFLHVIAKWWGVDFVLPNQKLFIAPIVKVLEHKAPTTVSQVGNRGYESLVASQENIGMDGLKEIAGTLQEALVEVLGGGAYYSMYKLLRNERNEVKEARKRQAAFELAINPERAAKRRRKKAESRKRKKKGG